VNIDGEVIGIPTLAAVNPGAGSQAQGIGFAIPASAALSIGRGLIAASTAPGQANGGHGSTPQGGAPQRSAAAVPGCA
jgi:S1-C subfamily serine protease